MDSARVQDLIQLMDISDSFFRKRLIEVLLKAITSQLLIHNELWEGIYAIKQKFGHHPEIGAVLSAQFENIFNKMFSFADNSFSPNSIIKILQECHLYLQLSIDANSQITFLTSIEETAFYPILKKLKEHPVITAIKSRKFSLSREGGAFLNWHYSELRDGSPPSRGGQFIYN